MSRILGVNHYDVSLSATHLLTLAQFHYLILLLQTAPKPILIHCEGGADRTGFAVAMWRLMQGDSLLKAKRAFSIRYFVHWKNSLGKQVLPIYERWLGRHHYKTSSEHFMQWVLSTKLGNSG